MLWQVSAAGSGVIQPAMLRSPYSPSLVSGALTGCLQRCALLQSPRRCEKMGAARAETGANRGMNVGRKPAWNGRFRHGSPETPVNIGLAGRRVFCDAASATASLLSVTGIAIRQKLKKQYKSITQSMRYKFQLYNNNMYGKHSYVLMLDCHFLSLKYGVLSVVLNMSLFLLEANRRHQ